MNEEESIIYKFKQKSFIEKIIIILSIGSLCVILLGKESNINKDLSDIAFILFCALSFFMIPSMSYQKIINKKECSRLLNIIWMIQGVNVVVFIITAHRVLLSNEYSLNLSYYFFIGSYLLLTIIGIGGMVYKDIKDTKEMTEEEKKKNKMIRILKYVNIVIFVVFLEWSTMPFIYTTVGGEDLKEIKKPSSIGISKVYAQKRGSNEKDENDKTIYDDIFIEKIVSQINKNALKSIKGVEALNCIKRNEKLDYYMMGTFWLDDGGNFASLDIYEDGYVVFCTYSFEQSFLVRRYYKVNIAQEIINKII
ncbi:hypothetical protein [Anaerophilus nitritogenes]|uniref:hypothetical protein n=1 Tax=Anaerophilus nitritogenes TaxID=2498136 RepID=UPI00101C13E9|nr:hypothetical protein [Anaerophilus nitritogenes]